MKQEIYDAVTVNTARNALMIASHHYTGESAAQEILNGASISEVDFSVLEKELDEDEMSKLRQLLYI